MIASFLLPLLGCALVGFGCFDDFGFFEDFGAFDDFGVLLGFLPASCCPLLWGGAWLPGSDDKTLGGSGGGPFGCPGFVKFLGGPISVWLPYGPPWIPSGFVKFFGPPSVKLPFGRGGRFSTVDVMETSCP